MDENVFARELIDIRRRIHRHPETCREEFETARLVQAYLEALGLEVTTGYADTGVIALLRGGAGEGRTILLRADMDALPCTETSGAPYASEIPGKMHSCGHDAHTAWLLGAAKLLAARRDTMRGNVKFCFQPAEERIGGAKQMIEEGILQNPAVDFAVAAHCYPELPCGCVAVDEKEVTACALFFTIDITGRGGHGSMPHRSRDPIIAMVRIYEALQDLSGKRISPFEPTVLQVCMMNAGNSRGAIPDTAQLQGTIRVFNREHIPFFEKQLQEIARDISALYETQAKCHCYTGAYSVYNDPIHAKLVRGWLQKQLGENCVVSMREKFLGGEDFSHFSDHVPCVYLFLGTNDGTPETSHPLHNPCFNLAEEAIPKTAHILAQVALEYLAVRG